MSKQLFPVISVPALKTQSTTYDTAYRRSAKWNPMVGDFVRDGANHLVECDGKEAFAVWCFKTAQTERYRCLAYPDSIGTEMERALGDDVKKTESMIQRTVTEALMVNPRTEYVRDFEFFWNGEKMGCSFKVKGIGMGTFVVNF